MEYKVWDKIRLSEEGMDSYTNDKYTPHYMIWEIITKDSNDNTYQIQWSNRETYWLDAEDIELATIFKVWDKVKLKKWERHFFERNLPWSIWIIENDKDQSSLKVVFPNATEFRNANELELVRSDIECDIESLKLKAWQWFRFKAGSVENIYTILYVKKDKIAYHKDGRTYEHKIEWFYDKIILVNNPQDMYPNTTTIPSILKTNKPNMTNTFAAAKVKKYLTDKKIDEIIKAEEELTNLIEQLESASSDIDEVVKVLREDLEDLQEGQEDTNIDTLKRVMSELKETLEFVNNFKKNTVESLAPVVTEVKRTMEEKFNR